MWNSRSSGNIKINSLHQMNARHFVQLKTSMRYIFYPFIQREYNVFWPGLITLPFLCFFFKNKKTIVILKRQKHQPWNTKGFIAQNKSHKLSYLLSDYAYKHFGWMQNCKNEILHLTFLIKLDFQYADGISQHTSITTRRLLKNKSYELFHVLKVCLIVIWCYLEKPRAKL